MLNELYIECNHLYAVGDIHGYFNELAFMLKRYDLKDDCIVICGDCGLGFSSPQATKQDMSKLNKACRERNMRIVMVRGNHDDPKYFEEGLANTKYLIAVPDYTVINGNILVVGGGVSIDRMSRKDTMEINMRHYKKYHPGCSDAEAFERINKCYWPNELPVYDEEKLNEIENAGIRIEHVMTHTCPSFCEPTTKDGVMGWIARDPGLMEDLSQERLVMNQIYDFLEKNGHCVKTWTYGHYHKHCSQLYYGIKFTMLDCVGAGSMSPDWIEICDYVNTIQTTTLQ